MENRIIRRFLKAMVREERHMKPFLLKCGLALALTFAGFLYSHMRTKRIKPSTTTTSPRGHHTHHGSQVNLGGGLRANSSFCSSVLEGNTVDIEDACMKRVISNNSLIGHSPRNKQTGEKDEFLLHEFSDQVKEADFGQTTGRSSFKKDVETPRSRVGSPTAYGSRERDEHEQEIRQLRNMIGVLQQRERSLEVQLLEYCGLREQETAVMELQNRLKISSMEAKMFNLKVETLQSENRRLEAQVADHARVLAELETAKTKVKFLKKKIRYEAEQNREQIMNLKQKVSKLQDQESKSSDREVEAKLKRLKELEFEAEELRKSNMRLQTENSDLARRLESTQILAQTVLEEPEVDAQKKDSERLREENEGLVKEMEQLQADRCSNVEELVYMRWINACLRHELRHYHPPPGKTAARDLSKSLSPTSEKKAKQLILEYANTDGVGNISFADSDQWSSSQASFQTDSGDTDDYSPHDNSSDARANPANKNKVFGKLMKLIRGKDSRHHLGRVTSREKSRSQDDSNSPRLSSSTANDAAADGSRSDVTPSNTARTSLDFERPPSLKEEDRRNSDSLVVGSSKSFSPKNRNSVDSKNQVDSFQDSSGTQKSNLVKYAEALKDSSGSGKRVVHRRPASYSSF